MLNANVHSHRQVNVMKIMKPYERTIVEFISSLTLVCGGEFKTVENLTLFHRRDEL